MISVWPSESLVRRLAACGGSALPIGYAALSLSPVDSEVLTVEYKVNHLAPARGARLVAVGHVVRPGRTVSICAGEVLAVNAGVEVRVAMMLATMIRRQAKLS